MVNFSDIGTKSLTRSRLYFLLHEIGAVDPENLSTEEHSMVMDQIQATNTLSKLVRFVKSVSLVVGTQGLESVAAESSKIQWTLDFVLLRPWISNTTK